MKQIPYGRQSITEEDKKAVIETLESDFLTQGPKVAAFEQEFASYIGARYAVAVANGTAALHLSAIALGVGPDSKVITTPITFAASANCVRYCGGQVEFVDIDPHTYTLDLNKLESLLKASAPGAYAGIIPVDFAGYPIDLEKLRAIAQKYGLWLLEDACHAPGGYFMGQNGQKHRCGDGTYADAAIFSFHPVKHIATGEGGMITTNRMDIYEKLLLLRTHGITKDPQKLIDDHGGWYYEMQELGYNYRLSDMQAALGLSQLKRADAGIGRRKSIAQRYDHALGDLPVVLPKIGDGVAHAWHLYVIQTDRRKYLYDHLRKHNIFCQVHYIPVHLQPYYKSLGWKSGDMPVAESYYDRCLSLPMYPSLTDEEQDYVIEHIKSFF